MVLVILAVVWAIVLIPPMIRAKAEGRPSDSITNFRQQLNVLRRTGPSVGSIGGQRGPSAGTSPLATVSRIDVHGPRGSLRPGGTLPYMPRNSLVSASAASRQRAQRRRRDILVILLVLSAGTLGLGLIPSLRTALLINVVIDVLLFSYVGLLIRQRNATAERDMKVRFLPGMAMGPSVSGQAREAAMMRRSAN